MFDIRALWRSGLSARAPECQKLKTMGNQYGAEPFEQQQLEAAGVEGVKLVMYWFGLKGTERLVCMRSTWRMTASQYDRQPTTSIVQCRYVRGFKNSHKSGRSIFHCCWSATLKQLTSPST